MAVVPLNGTKTHPLKRPSKDAMCRLSAGKVRPAQEFNAGVIDRLIRGGYIELVSLPSPYERSRGKHIAHAKLTAAGQRLVTLGFPS